MIDTVVFENEHGEKFMPYEQYGIYMKSHGFSPPKPKLYRYALDGMDGEIDLSEWSGEVKFEPREVNISFREMGESAYVSLTQFALGKMIKVMFSDDPEYYCYGRCTDISTDIKNRVTDVNMTVLCDPYRLRRGLTVVNIDAAERHSVTLRAKRMTAIPQFTASKACSVSFEGETYSLPAGSRRISAIKITDSPKTITFIADSDTTIRISWTDGVL